MGPYFTKKWVLIGSLSQSLGVLISFGGSGKNGYASPIGLLEGLIMTFAHLSRSGSAGSNDQGDYRTKSNIGGGGGVLVDGQGPRNNYDCRGDGRHRDVS